MGHDMFVTYTLNTLRLVCCVYAFDMHLFITHTLNTLRLVCCVIGVPRLAFYAFGIIVCLCAFVYVPLQRLVPCMYFLGSGCDRIVNVLFFLSLLSIAHGPLPLFPN